MGIHIFFLNSSACVSLGLHNVLPFAKIYKSVCMWCFSSAACVYTESNVRENGALGPIALSIPDAAVNLLGLDRGTEWSACNVPDFLDACFHYLDLCLRLKIPSWLQRCWRTVICRLLARSVIYEHLRLPCQDSRQCRLRPLRQRGEYRSILCLCPRCCGRIRSLAAALEHLHDHPRFQQ